MRDIEIILSKETFIPGDSVEGYVLIRCDDEFKCNSINMSFLGEERTKFVVHTGKVTIVYDDDKEHFNEQIELAPASTIPFGETRYDFSFKLPEEIPASYLGSYGWIEYTLQAKIEISWARDPKTKLLLEVTRPEDSELMSPQSFQDRIEGDMVSLLRVEGSSDIVNLGEGYAFRVMVDRDAKIRGLRAELIHIEHVEPDGRETDKETPLVEWYMKDEDLRRDSFIEVTLETQSDWPIPFTTDLIQCHYILKVTLDIPRRIDKNLIFPIRQVRLRSSGMDSEFSSTF